MGVDNLASEIKPIIKRTKINDYICKTLAVDASLIIYQVVIGIRKCGRDLENKSGEMTTHIVGLLHKIRSIMHWGIELIFVFDGKPPKFKFNELNNRKLKKKKAKEEFEYLKKTNGDKDKQTKYFKRMFSLNEKIVVDCKRLLDLLGIKYIQAIGEADAALAALSMSNYVDGIITDDLDVLVHGGKKILKNFTTKGNKNDYPIEEINLPNVLEYLKMNNHQLIDFAILLGTDYSNSIKGIGPSKAKEGIRTFGCALQFVENLKKKGNYEIPDNFDNMYRWAYDYYIDPYGYDFMFHIENKTIDQYGLVRFLCDENDFNKEEVENSINKIALYRNKMETDGASWFIHHHEDKRIRSNRMKAGCYNFPKRQDIDYNFRKNNKIFIPESTSYNYKKYNYMSRGDKCNNWRGIC